MRPGPLGPLVRVLMASGGRITPQVSLMTDSPPPSFRMTLDKYSTHIKWARRAAIALFVLGVIALIVVWGYFAALGRDVPSIAKLKQYEPPITSRVHAGDGTLIAEFADQHRVFVPYESIPEHVVQAFVSAEDKNFFTHDGLDYVGITRGAVTTAKNKLTGDGGMQGGSTITQQYAKNAFLTQERSFSRKAQEIGRAHV